MKILLPGLSCLALCTLLLSGCGGQLAGGGDQIGDRPGIVPPEHRVPPSPARKRFYDALFTWTGAPASELFISWGKPTKMRLVGGFGYDWHLYTYTRPNPAKSSSLADSKSGANRPCTVKVTVTSENIINRVVADTWFDCTKTKPWPARPKS